MKFLLNLFGIALAGALGYHFEPELRPLLTGKAAPAVTASANPPALPEAPPSAPTAIPEPVIPVPAEVPAPAPVEPPVEIPPAPVGDSFEPQPEPVPVPLPVEPEKPMIEPIPPLEPPPIPGENLITPGIQAMQESIRGGKVTEFAYDKVIEWKDEAEETLEGETYQTGVITYEAETLLGMKRMQAKAYIKDGKVTRWVGLKTGVEIK